jgi:sugar lactone lactonase YvrE
MTTISLRVSLGLVAIAALLVGCASSGVAKPHAVEVFYPPPPAEPRLQLLARFSDSSDIHQDSSFKRFIAGDEPKRSIERAQGMAWHAGSLYVCDPGVAHVVVCDLVKRELRALDPGRRRVFRKPLDIAIAPDGWKYITDTVQRRVVVYDREDRYQGTFGDPAAWRPVGIATTPDRLYVTDVANHVLVELDRKTGRELARIGRGGNGKGEFHYPVAVAVGPQGDLYVADSFNFRVQRLRPDGTFVSSIGKAGRQLGDFARPRGVAVDREGRIYALDGAFENCQIFNAEGKLLMFFGGPGSQPGAINLPGAVRVSYAAADAFRERVAAGFDIEYVVFVSSQAGLHKVNAYGFLRKRR